MWPPLHELEVDLLGTVALTGAELHDARVPAAARRVARRDVAEQLVDDLLVAQQRDRLPARVEVVALAQRDGLLDDAAYLFGARLAGLDLLVLEQLAGKTREQRAALVGRHVELATGTLVAHYSSPR